VGGGTAERCGGSSGAGCGVFRARDAELQATRSVNAAAAAAAAAVACRWFLRIALSVSESRLSFKLGNLNGAFSTLNFDFKVRSKQSPNL
jgi:hypothetical protein